VVDKPVAAAWQALTSLHERPMRGCYRLGAAPVAIGGAGRTSCATEAEGAGASGGRLLTGAEILRTLPVSLEGVHWTSVIGPGQYALFESQAEARAWGEEICARHARARCDIYDSEGLVNDAVESICNAAVKGNYVGPKPARWRLFGGLASLFVGTALIAWDFHRDLLFMWGYVLGIKWCWWAELWRRREP
jgi:hypothetical protein